MAALFDPFLEMARVQRDINRLFGDANRNYLDNYYGGNPTPLEALLDIVVAEPTDVAPTRRNKDANQTQGGQQTSLPPQHAQLQTQPPSQTQQLALHSPWARGLVMPRLDVWDEDHQTCIQVEVPGFAKDKLNIEVQDGLLHVSGEMRQEDKKEQHNLIHSERRFGSFKRSIRLPKHIKENDIQAAYTDGILTITVPHAEPPKQQKRLITIADGNRPVQHPTPNQPSQQPSQQNSAPERHEKQDK